MEPLRWIIEFFQKGGWFMYPIVGVLSVGAAIVLERLFYLARSKGNGARLWRRIHDSVAAADFAAAQEAARGHGGLVGRVLAVGLKTAGDSGRREAVKEALEESILEVMPALERRTSYLPTLANVATLLGLLGTIVGLIQAFTAVSAADPAEKATILAQGISVAMNTTAFGLIVAIPLMLTYSYLQAQTNQIVDALEFCSVRLVNTLPASGKAGQGGVA